METLNLDTIVETLNLDTIVPHWDNRRFLKDRFYLNTNRFHDGGHARGAGVDAKTLLNYKLLEEKAHKFKEKSKFVSERFWNKLKEFGVKAKSHNTNFVWIIDDDNKHEDIKQRDIFIYEVDTGCFSFRSMHQLIEQGLRTTQHALIIKGEEASYVLKMRDSDYSWMRRSCAINTIFKFAIEERIKCFIKKNLFIPLGKFGRFYKPAVFNISINERNYTIIAAENGCLSWNDAITYQVK